MDKLGGTVRYRTAGFVAAKWLALLALALAFDARWPAATPARGQSPARDAWENWMILGFLVALCATLNVAVVVTLIRPKRISGFAVVLVGWLTSLLVLFEFAFLGAMLWPRTFSLALDWRLRTIVAILVVLSVPFVVALLRGDDAEDLPNRRTMLARLGLWLAFLGALGFLYWWVPVYLER